MSTQLFDIYPTLEQPDGVTSADGEASGISFRFLALPQFEAGLFTRRATLWFAGIPDPDHVAWARERGFTAVEFVDAHRCANGGNLSLGTGEHNLAELDRMFEEGIARAVEAAAEITDQVFLKLQLGGFAA